MILSLRSFTQWALVPFATATLLSAVLVSPTCADDFTPATVDRSGDPTVGLVDNGRGRINYGAGVVKATGYGAPPAHANSPAQAKLMALGAARADALRTLAMTVSSIQVTATTKVKNYELKSDTVETHISALLQSPRIVSENVQPDGTAVVIVDLPMYGDNSVASVVLPQVLPPAPASTDNANTGVNGAGADANGNFVGPPEPATPVTPPVAIADEADTGNEPGLTPASDNGPFSAVIVDCRGLGIESIMSPKLIDTTGREVYGTVHVSPEYAIETGIVGYPRSMRQALRTARAGSHPLIVRALRAADTHRFNPVVSLEDADRILAANGRDHFLEQTRVIFLIDPIR